MMPQVFRGHNPTPLLAYLARDERGHEPANLVAGSPHVLAWYSHRELSHEDALSIGAELNQTHRVYGVTVGKPGHVWHCPLSLPKQDGVLSDEQWEAITTEFVRRMGFIGQEGKADTPWAAVRHGGSNENGNDHVHVVVSLVREDGTKADVWKDYDRAQAACRYLEEATGLTRVVGDLSPRETTFGERQAAAARGRSEAERTTLERVVRACSVASRTEDEFVRRVRAEGVRVRASYTADEHVRGYSVALAPARDEAPIYYAGSSLGRDLGLGVLRGRWHEDESTRAAAADEWRAASRGLRVVAPGREVEEPDFDSSRMGEVLKGWQDRIEGLHPDDKEGWRSAAADLSGVFAHWSRATEPEPGPLAALSSELSRSAQLSRREYRPQRTRSELGLASSAMVTWMVAKNDRMAPVAVFRRLSSLSAAVRDHHQARGDYVRTSGLERVARERLVHLNADLHARAGLSVPTGPAAAPAPTTSPTWEPKLYEKNNTKHGSMTR